MNLPAWLLQQITTSREGKEAVVHIFGNYGPAHVEFELRIDGAGLIATKYKLVAFPFTPPEPHPTPWNDSHFGGFSEVGISFVLADGIDRLAWDRRALWSVYPADHIGRSVGLAQLATSNSSWAQSSGNGGRGGPVGAAAASSATNASNDFRAMKEYIYSAVALKAGTDLGLQAISDAHDALRMDTTNIANGGGISMIVNNEWNYPQLGNSNYMKPPIKVGEGYSNTVRVRFAHNSVTIEPTLLQK